MGAVWQGSRGRRSRQGTSSPRRRLRTGQSARLIGRSPRPLDWGCPMLHALLISLLLSLVGADDPMADVVRDNDRFACDLYGRLRERPGNLFYSPYSLSTALAMTYAGARGETADQM